MFDFVGVGVLIVLIVLFGWLASRAWRSKRRILKWVGVVVAGLLTLVLTLALVVALIGFYQLNAAHNNPVANVKVAGTPAQIARGERFAQLCAGCHATTEKPPLVGGPNFGADSPPLGTLYPPNLTPTHLKDWSDGEILRAVREGVHKSGRSLIIMPAELFHNISDADAQSIVAYLRAQSPAVPDTPPTNINVIGALIVGTGAPLLAAQAPIAQAMTTPPVGTTEYGQYLVSVVGCRSCHGDNLAGGTPGFGPPPGPNLTTIVPKWSEAEFFNAIRNGVDPKGAKISDEMPWKSISAFATDDDLKAMYAYLKTLTPISSK